VLFVSIAVSMEIKMRHYFRCDPRNIELCENWVHFNSLLYLKLNGHNYLKLFCLS
jgi:hypothetical protein